MCVKDALACTGTGIEESSITIEAFSCHDLIDEREDGSEHLRITLRGSDCVLLVIFRDDEDMSGRHWIDVVDGEGPIILSDLRNRNLTRCKLTEEAIHVAKS
jgi:hypothetical protein